MNKYLLRNLAKMMSAVGVASFLMLAPIAGHALVVSDGGGGGGGGGGGSTGGGSTGGGGATQVPEPDTLVLMTIGALGIVAMRRRKK